MKESKAFIQKQVFEQIDSDDEDSQSDDSCFEEVVDTRPEHVRIADNLKTIQQSLKGNDKVVQLQLSEAIKFI